MNRNLLKWILIIAVVLGAAAYLYFAERDTYVKWHSHAFEIEPIEGITISAAENTLDKDREITLAPVKDKEYDKICEVFSEQGIEPLFVFDYHTGLKSDESFPGDVNFDVDLDRLGIPRDLQDRVWVYRYTSSDNGGIYRYLTQIQDGHLRFSSNQNSNLIFAFCPFIYCQKKFTEAFLGTLWELADGELQHVPASVFYKLNYSTITIPIPDKHGDFILTFRFCDTENPDGYKAYVALQDKAIELEERAKKLYEDKVKAEVDKEQEGYSFWQKLFSKKQVQAIRERIHYEEVLLELVNDDPVLKAFVEDPTSQLPKSVQTFIGYVKQANKFLDEKGVHPLDREIYVYLVDNSVLGSENYGVANKVPGGKCYLLLNYSKYNANIENPSMNQSRREGVLLTSIHELFHTRQKLYYCTIKMDSYVAEATAVTMEWDAARELYRQGVIKTDPSTNANQDNLSLTKRKEHQIFNVPFDKITSRASGVDVGYTLSVPIEDIRKSAGKEDDVSMAAFVSNYNSQYGPNAIGWTGWVKKSLEINDDELNKGWLYFGEKNLANIVEKQASIMDKTPDNEFASKIVKPTPETPVVPLKELSTMQDYTVRSYEIQMPSNGLPGKRNITQYGRVFVTNLSKESNPYVSFYFDTNNRFSGLEQIKPAHTHDNIQTGLYTIGVITTSQSWSESSDNQFYLVALFAPEAPYIKKVKKDVITFDVPKPVRELRKKGLVSGVEFTYTDKNGHIETYIAGPDQFGDRVTWTIPGCSAEGNAFTLSCHWFYDLDANTICSSPESEKTEYGIMPEEKKAEEIIVIDETQGYWKQINARCLVESKKIDESELTDGLATYDMRGIEMHTVSGENEIEFTGKDCIKITEDGKTLYQPETILDGYVSYTEPPKQWPVNTNYTCEWYVDQDPFRKKMDNPFTFLVENASSAPKVCEQGNDKVTEKNSNIGEAKWLNQVKTVFKTNAPDKDDPKGFVITQQYTISSPTASDIKAVVTLTFEYEWVEGEMEEEEVKVPEGGCWQLVKVYEDDSSAHFENHLGEGKNKCDESISITGGSSRFNLNADKSIYGLHGTVNQSASIVAPKTIYIPGEQIEFSYSIGERSVGGDLFDYELSVGRSFITNPFEAGKELTVVTAGAWASLNSGDPYMQNMVVPSYADWARHFTIVDQGMAGAGFNRTWHYTVYEYQWVDKDN